MGLTSRSFELEVNRVNFNSKTRVFIPSTLTFFIKEKFTVNGDVITPQRFTHGSSPPLILTREGDVQLVEIQPLKMDLAFSLNF